MDTIEGSFDSQEFYDFVAEDVRFYSESGDQLPTDSDHHQPEWCIPALHL
jgi:hypothetical protein